MPYSASHAASTVVLSAAYFPPIEYFFAIARSGRVLIEQHEFYQKQSYRNRCRILSSQGAKSLSIPVVKDSGHSRPVRDIRIDYSYPWLQQHRRAIEAAYNSSPFYLYYKDDFEEIFERRPEFLFDLDLQLLEKLLEMVGLRAEIALTETFVKDYSALTADDAMPYPDLRERIHPKFHGPSLMDESGVPQEYFQVFAPRLGFHPNLSILDLLCSEGPNAISFL